MVSPIALENHPWALAIAEEIHARPIVPIPGSCRIRRVAGLLAPRDHGFAGDFVASLLAQGLVEASEASQRRFAYTVQDMQIVFEVHTEFVTLTWFGPSDGKEAEPADIGLEHFNNLGIVSRTRVDCISSARISEAAMKAFDPISLCHSIVEDGLVDLATDFRPDSAGYVRYELAVGDVSDIKGGILVRRVLEIDTYRAMALLGLPLVRDKSKALGALEVRLTEAIRASTGKEVDRLALLSELNDLHSAVSILRDECRYRFDATAAYGDVLRTRLSSLDEVPSGDGRGLGKFLMHRVAPALSTAASVGARLDAALEELRGTIDVLNARIAFDTQNQSRQILTRISETGRRHYELQATIEALSVLAITYYGVGLVGYLTNALAAVMELDHDVVTGASIPFVLVAVIVGLKVLRARVGRGSPQA